MIRVVVHPRSGSRLLTIPDPGSRGPNPGSATLVFVEYERDSQQSCGSVSDITTMIICSFYGVLCLKTVLRIRDPGVFYPRIPEKFFLDPDLGSNPYPESFATIF
jgi:hypothetical protein